MASGLGDVRNPGLRALLDVADSPAEAFLGHAGVVSHRAAHERRRPHVYRE
jgi:hypothetical protein